MREDRLSIIGLFFGGILLEVGLFSLIAINSIDNKILLALLFFGGILMINFSFILFIRPYVIRFVAKMVFPNKEERDSILLEDFEVMP